MIHTVHIDDTTANGKRLMQDMRMNKDGVEIEENNKVAEAPAGYLTSDEFWKEADKRIAKVCKDHGIL